MLVLASGFAALLLQILQAWTHYMSNEVAITNARVLISPFGDKDISRWFSSHLLQIPLKFKVNFCSFTTSLKGTNIQSWLQRWILCTGLWEAACLPASREAITPMPQTQFVEYIAKAMWKILLGFTNGCPRAFSWDGEKSIYTSKTEECPWIYLPSSFRS